MDDKEKRQIKILLYLNKRITERITNAIEEEVMKDRFSFMKLEDSLHYIINEEFKREWYL